MRKHVRNESVCRRLLNILRMIPKKLWRHKVVTAILLLVGVVTFATMVFAAYYGFTAWMHQRRTLAEADLLRVEADVREYNDPAQLWTEEKIAQVVEQGLADFGYPLKDVSVQLTLDGKKFQFASLEGVIGREPEFQRTSLAWGRAVGRESKPELLLSQQCFQRLGGKIAPDGSPQPPHVCVVITRVADGATQTQRLEMRIAGLLKRDDDKLRGPLDLVIHLDQWQTHKSDSPLGETCQTLESLASYDSVDAYVPETLAGEVAKEEAAFGVRAERAGQLEVVVPQGDLWAALAPKRDTEKLDQAAVPDLARASGAEAWLVWLGRLHAAGGGSQDAGPPLPEQPHADSARNPPEASAVVCAALADDDPRWQRAPGGAAPEFGKLLAVSGDLERLGKACPAWVAIEPMGRPLPGVPQADLVGTLRTVAWLRFDESRTSVVIERTHIDIEGLEAALRLEKWCPGAVHPSASPQRFWMLRNAPPSQWQEFVDQQKFDPDRVRVSRLLVLPAALRASGRVVAEQIMAIPDRDFPGSSDRDVLLAGAPPGDSRVVAARGPRQPAPGGGSAASIDVGPQRFGDLVVREDPSVPPGHARVSMSLFRRLAFARAEQQKALPDSGEPVVTVRLPDVHAFRQAERDWGARGCRLEPMVELARRKVLRYALHAAGDDGRPGPVSPQKAAELVMARPTFQAVSPRLGVAVEMDGEEVTVVSATGRDDLVWFEWPLVAGCPLAAGAAERELVLSRQTAERLFPGLLPQEVVGRSVRLKLVRHPSAKTPELSAVPPQRTALEQEPPQENRLARNAPVSAVWRTIEPDVSLLARVAGVTEGPTSYALLDQVTGWRLWSEGKVVYDRAGSRFRTPAEVYRSRGFISAVFYALSRQRVRPLVEHLAPGCEVHHRLDDQTRLAQLAVAVTTLVFLFVMGSVLNASANSGAVSWMDLATKLKEIGVKMAYGVTRKDILFSYLAEGFVVGAAACLLGTLLVVACHPVLRCLIRQTIGLGDEFFIIPIFAPVTLWIYAAAAAVVIGFNMLGTLVPTCLALRKSPVELMH